MSKHLWRAYRRFEDCPVPSSVPPHKAGLPSLEAGLHRCSCRRHRGRRRCWSNWLESQGFQKAGYEGAMWSKKDKDGDTILVATHVDDSIVTGSNDDKTDTFVSEMLDRFDGTCEGNLTEMLGMEWERDIEASILHQKAFTEKLLKAFGFWQ
jgi:hypothetical protein